MERRLEYEKMLARGVKNLAALKAVHSKPTTSLASKKTLAEMIVKQADLNAALLKEVNLPQGAVEQN